MIIPGWVSQDEIAALYQNTLATFAPYENTEDFKKSIPNKIIESFAYGLPVITSLNGEVEKFFEQTKAGLIYKNSDELYSICKNLLNDRKKQSDLKKRANAAFENYFDFTKSYNQLSTILEQLGRLSER